MHSSLPVTAEGIPLRFSAIKFWTRKKFKGTAALKNVNLNPQSDREEGEHTLARELQQSSATLGDPARGVHVGDRESDIYELFCLAQKAGTHRLVRTCVDRLAGDGNHKVTDEMKRVEISGPHRIEVHDADGKPGRRDPGDQVQADSTPPADWKTEALPSAGGHDHLCLRAGAAEDRKRIDWMLITDLPGQSFREAVETLQWYSLGWKIDLFHKFSNPAARLSIRSCARQSGWST